MVADGTFPKAPALTASNGTLTFPLSLMVTALVALN